MQILSALIVGKNSLSLVLITMLRVFSLAVTYVLAFTEFFIFIFVWLIFVLGIFVVARVLFRSIVAASVINFLAFSFTSSCIFQLIKMHRESVIKRDLILYNGPPLNCAGFLWLTNFFSRYSCEEYYESLYSNGVNWQLNVFVVTTQLFSDVARAVAAMTGRVFGALLSSAMDELHWSYRIPAFLLVTVCLMSTILALFGYRFSIGYGFFQADFSQFGKGKWGASCGPAPADFIRYERVDQNPVQLLCEAYQKRFSGLQSEHN